MKEKTFGTNYSVAVNWCNNNYIMQNDICELDFSVIENCRFDVEKEIFQYFITDCSQFDVEYLEENFGLLFSYSNLLDKYILCVDHFGTNWSYVYCETKNELAARELGENK